MSGALAEVPAGKREATKAANRAAILAAARVVFAELGYGASSVRAARQTGGGYARMLEHRADRS